MGDKLVDNGGKRGNKVGIAEKRRQVDKESYTENCGQNRVKKTDFGDFSMGIDKMGDFRRLGESARDGA